MHRCFYTIRMILVAASAALFLAGCAWLDKDRSTIPAEVKSAPRLVMPKGTDTSKIVDYYPVSGQKNNVLKTSEPSLMPPA
jgi:hypothetical protein